MHLCLSLSLSLSLSFPLSHCYLFPISPGLIYYKHTPYSLRPFDLCFPLSLTPTRLSFNYIISSRCIPASFTPPLARVPLYFSSPSCCTIIFLSLSLSPSSYILLPLSPFVLSLSSCLIPLTVLFLYFFFSPSLLLSLLSHSLHPSLSLHHLFL